MTKGKIFIIHQNMKKMFWIYNFLFEHLSVCKHWFQNLINYVQTLKNITHFRRKIFMFDLEMMWDFNDPISSFQKNNNVWKKHQISLLSWPQEGKQKKTKDFWAFCFQFFSGLIFTPPFTIMYNSILLFTFSGTNTYTANYLQNLIFTLHHIDIQTKNKIVKGNRTTRQYC